MREREKGGFGMAVTALESLARKHSWQQIEAMVVIGRGKYAKLHNPAGWLTKSLQEHEPVFVRETQESGKKGGETLALAEPQDIPRAEDRVSAAKTRARMDKERAEPDVTPASVLKGLKEQLEWLQRVGMTAKVTEWEKKVAAQEAVMALDAGEQA